jgi:hypothetical protein
MFAASFQYFPTGVRIPLRQGFKAETTVDEAFVALMKTLNTGQVSGECPYFRKDVIRHARRLLGNLVDFLDAQDQNTRLSVNGYEYLKDTIEFLNKGYRSVHSSSRIGLVAADYVHNQSTNPKAENRRERLRDLLQIAPEEFIFIWLRHPNGFADMLCTVNFLFGTDPSVNAR